MVFRESSGCTNIICMLSVQRLALDDGEHFKGVNQIRVISAYSVQHHYYALFLVYGVNAVILSYL